MVGWITVRKRPFEKKSTPTNKLAVAEYSKVRMVSGIETRSKCHRRWIDSAQHEHGPLGPPLLRSLTALKFDVTFEVTWRVSGLQPPKGRDELFGEYHP